MMGQHGFINWDDDDKKCYEQTLAFIERAAQLHRGRIPGQGRRRDRVRRREIPDAGRVANDAKPLAAILPWLRGQVSQQKRFIGTVQDDENSCAS